VVAINGFLLRISLDFSYENQAEEEKPSVLTNGFY